MKAEKIKEGCAYWARLPYDNPKHNECHIVVVLKIRKGVLWNTYTVIPLTTSTRNILDIGDHQTMSFKNTSALVKHYEIQSLSSRKFIKFAFKPSERQFKNLKEKVLKWLSDSMGQD